MKKECVCIIFLMRDIGGIMYKKLQVFVSSTYSDLIEERQTAVEAILDAGHIPAGMELFKAGKSQMRTIQKWIDESDVYMLILGGRYGSIEPESQLSYTQLEYEYAVSKDMPVFAIVLSDSLLHTKEAKNNKNYTVFEEDNIDKYNLFKKLVMSKIVKEVDDILKISSIVHATLNGLLEDDDYQLSGWVKADFFTNSDLTSFRELTNTLKSVIAYEESKMKSPISYYDHFKKYINNYLVGVSDSYCQNVYRYYSQIYLLNGLVESVIDKNGEEIFRLTKLGYEYYNYLIASELKGVGE